MAIRRGKEMDVTIDDLHERIEILYHNKTRDINGNIVDGEVHTRGAVWAKIIPVTARIGEQPEETKNEIIYRVTIRHRGDIEPTDKILWRGKRLELTSPPYDVESRRIWTVMECRELVENVEEA